MIKRFFYKPLTYFLVVTIALFMLVVLAVLYPSLMKSHPFDVFYDVMSKLLIGATVSFLFYYLLVRLPEFKRRKIIKQNLRKEYGVIKKEIARDVVSASVKGGRNDISSSMDINSLLTPEGFESVFKEGCEAHEGFYAFRNQMDEPTYEYTSILHQLNSLKEHIEFVLHNYSISDADLFDQLVYLKNRISYIGFAATGYDESKYLCSFVWGMFTGYSFLDGVNHGDPIKRMIESL